MKLVMKTKFSLPSESMALAGQMLELCSSNDSENFWNRKKVEY